jgi:hypothetical protein
MLIHVLVIIVSASKFCLVSWCYAVHAIAFTALLTALEHIYYNATRQLRCYGAGIVSLWYTGGYYCGLVMYEYSAVSDIITVSSQCSRLVYMQYVDAAYCLKPHLVLDILDLP